MFLSCCANGAPKTKIPREALELADEPALPPRGASNHAHAAYLIDIEEWKDSAKAHVAGLIDILCAHVTCTDIPKN
jgi:hypothetical protein